MNLVLVVLVFDIAVM